MTDGVGDVLLMLKRPKDKGDDGRKRREESSKVRGEEAFMLAHVPVLGNTRPSSRPRCRQSKRGSFRSLLPLSVRAAWQEHMKGPKTQAATA